jgi:hypothetical protein
MIAGETQNASPLITRIAPRINSDAGVEAKLIGLALG